MATTGTALLDKIAKGEISSGPRGISTKIRQDISVIFEEIIEVGARIRPILENGKRIGWIRGLSVTEKKLLNSWFYEKNELLVKALSYATTFTEEEIKNLDSYKFRSLLRLSTLMSSADASLYPYIVPYISTSSSDDLWKSGGTSLTQFFNNKIEMPDGRVVKILCPSDHSRFWASLCDRRTKALVDLSNSYNAALVAGAMAGKAVKKVITDLNKRSKMLDINSDEPWKNIHTVDETKDLDLNDGWGHAHEDFSEEGLFREGQGMMNYDKHEQFMELFYNKYVYREQEKQIITREEGITEEVTKIMTEKEVIEQERRDSKKTSDSVSKLQEEHGVIDPSFILG